VNIDTGSIKAAPLRLRITAVADRGGVVHALTDSLRQEICQVFFGARLGADHRADSATYGESLLFLVQHSRLK
jgi:hypothetical protein